MDRSRDIFIALFPSWNSYTIVGLVSKDISQDTRPHNLTRDLLTSPVAYTIQTLKFQNNGLGEGGVIIANCLKENYENAKRDGKKLDLRTFIAGRNRLENPGAKALGEAFSLIGTLEQIEVIQNGIQYEGMIGIADCIRNNPSLKILNLNDNIMTPRGAIAIAKALPKAEQLQVLNMGDCLVKSGGAKAIADGIRYLKHLKEVVLSYNEIRSDGGVAIARVCGSLQSVTKLHLDGNHFGDEGKKEVEEALGSRISVLTGLNEDEGVPSDDENENKADEEEEEEQEEKKDLPEKDDAQKAPFVFGQSLPTLVGSTDPNRNFGDFGNTNSGFTFSSLSSGTNIFASGGGNSQFTFKGAGSTLFSNPATVGDDNVEKEPDVHFEPLVQLKKVSNTKTGHEDETEMFKHRAKLFRLDKEAQMWKERGIGDIRILTNMNTKRSRLVMRRDVILKLCCNHFILKEMKMEPNSGSDKSLIWYTPQDCSDEDPKPETLAIRFKTAEICSNFHEAFEKARLETPEPGSEPKNEDPEPKLESKTDKDNKTEPFSFAGLASSNEMAPFAFGNVSPIKLADSDNYRDEYEPNVNFKPLVELQKVEVKAGTENEDVKFECRSKLYRFDKDQWKERGIGNIQILWNKDTRKSRILMRRDQVLKICCNHWITPEMEVSTKSGNDKFLTWNTLADFADEECKPEILAARFKTTELAAEFKATFDEMKGNINTSSTEDKAQYETNESVAAEAPEPKQESPPEAGFATILAAQREKWACETCYVSNNKNVLSCVACQNPNPNAPKDASKTVENKAPTSTFSFGMNTATDALAQADLGGVKSTFNFGNTSTPQTGFKTGLNPSFTFGNNNTNDSLFGTAPTISPEKEVDAKPSLFAGFSFGAAAPQPPQNNSFSFGGLTFQAGAKTTSTLPGIDYKTFVIAPEEAILEKITKPECLLPEIEYTNPTVVAEFLGRLSKVMTNRTESHGLLITDCLLKAAFSTTNYTPGDLINELLVTMGLIKSEHKSYKPESDIGNMLVMLGHAVQTDYFPENTAKIISAFIRKDKDKITSQINDCTQLLNHFSI